MVYRCGYETHGRHCFGEDALLPRGTCVGSDLLRSIAPCADPCDLSVFLEQLPFLWMEQVYARGCREGECDRMGTRVRIGRVRGERE